MMAKQKIKKITVHKNDEPASVVEKILDSDATEIVLSIPRFSKLVEALANFHLIRREAELLNKKIIIESVDDKAIELANLAKLQAVNPFFLKSRKQFSDIVVSSKSRGSKKEVHEKEAAKKAKFFAPEAPPAKVTPRVPPPSFKKTLIFISIAVIGLIGLFVAVKVLPRADITVIAKKHPWSFNDALLVDKLLVAPDAEENALPGQLFSETVELSRIYPASGKRAVEQKARGTLTIFNAYSSTAQPLVAATRFVTPDGKIYRLVRGVTVPGAEVVDGKIIPSRLDADVIADKAGEAYNIGPVSHFSIPGFKGSPKFDGFYGQSSAPMTGGLIGEVPYPTDTDLTKAEDALRAELKDELARALAGQIPERFTVINGASEMTFEKPTVIADASQSSTFTLQGKGTVRAMAFIEEDILDMMREHIIVERGDGFGIKDFELAYGEGRTDFNRGRLSFPIEFTARVIQRIDPEALREKIANKSEDELRAIIFGLPDVEGANITLWPFWVQRVPVNQDKVTVAID